MSVIVYYDVNIYIFYVNEFEVIFNLHETHNLVYIEEKYQDSKVWVENKLIVYTSLDQMYIQTLF